MTRVYLLSTYDEYGAEHVRATLDPARLPAMVKSYYPDPAKELAALAEVLKEEEIINSHGHNLSRGWGGLQLHIVPLE